MTNEARKVDIEGASEARSHGVREIRSRECVGAREVGSI